MKIETYIEEGAFKVQHEVKRIYHKMVEALLRRNFLGMNDRMMKNGYILKRVKDNRQITFKEYEDSIDLHNKYCDALVRIDIFPPQRKCINLDILKAYKRVLYFDSKKYRDLCDEMTNLLKTSDEEKNVMKIEKQKRSIEEKYKSTIKMGRVCDEIERYENEQEKNSNIRYLDKRRKTKVSNHANNLPWSILSK